jgi:hypothetical protein
VVSLCRRRPSTDRPNNHRRFRDVFPASEPKQL